MYKFKNISIIYDILTSILYTNKLIRQIHGLIVLIVMNIQQIKYTYIYIYILILIIFIIQNIIILILF